MLNTNSTSLPSTDCPITLTEMTDPVLAQDGHTYERSAIEKHIREHGLSPKTNQILSINALIPNRALREVLELRRQERGTHGASLSPSVASENNQKSYSELLSTVQNATTAEYHTNAMNMDETIVHVDLPKSSVIARNDLAPAHICCVIDVSGSMAAEAICHDSNGLENHTGLSILPKSLHRVSPITISSVLSPIPMKPKLSFVQRP